MKALIIGATGATGKDLVNVLLHDSDYTEVVTFVRHKNGTAHPKLSEVLTDFDQLGSVSDLINGDVWFSCLGTTLKAAGSKKSQRHIDYEIPLHFAEIAKRNGIPQAVLLSAYGASPDSTIFYSRIKGELEEKITALDFRSLIIFQPGMLLRKDTDRPSERIIAALLKFVNSLGIIRKFRPLPTELLAEKMGKAPKLFAEGRHIVALDKIFGF